MPGHSFEDEATVEDTFEEFERNRDIPGKIEFTKIQTSKVGFQLHTFLLKTLQLLVLSNCPF